VRLIENKIPVRIEIDSRTKFYESQTGVNIIANLPGGSKRDEIVMVGAHLDSWHGGTGATDDGAGCGIVIEAIRILKTLNLKMDRTVRMALWDAEEEGLLGSRAYVRKHFYDSETKSRKPEYSKLSIYLNVDDGTGKVRGMYLQGNDMARPIVDAWLTPFRDVGVTTTTLRGENGTDHIAFNEAGLPGFQVIQDWLDLGSRTHHSNMDVYDHLQPADLRQAAAVVAAFVYNAATRPQMMPRKGPVPPVGLENW
jgi:carboxypeptidase Q